MKKRLPYVYIFIIAFIIIFSQCISKSPAKESGDDIRGEKYAGASACISCHKNIYESYITTAHFKTSRPASETSVMGSFTSPGNIFLYSNNSKVVMEHRDSGLFQASYINDQPQEAHRFDIAIGSGRKAQTFLYWKDGQYFQLPVSLFMQQHSWANSPNFPADHPNFGRVIPSTCFGCHSSMVAMKPAKMVGTNISEEFEKNLVSYGIDCERCHGPAADHVEFQTTHPQEKKAMYITRIVTLRNQQKLDMCGICHSGLKTPQKSAFEFLPGDSLSDYFYPDVSSPSKATELDVHGTQYQLFTASKCFIKSNAMNCSSCHNPHASEKEDLKIFSQRCMNCHTQSGHNFCKLTTVPASTLIQNCIDCHMPAMPSGNITLLTNGKTIPQADLIRTHLISVYAEATMKQKKVPGLRSSR